MEEDAAMIPWLENSNEIGKAQFSKVNATLESQNEQNQQCWDGYMGSHMLHEIGQSGLNKKSQGQAIFSGRFSVI